MTLSPSCVTVFPPNNYLWLYLTSIAVFEALAVYLYQYRAIPGARPLILNLSCKALWLLSRVLYGATASMQIKMFWVNCSQMLQLLFLLFWFQFILEISQQKEKLPLFIRIGSYGVAACLVFLIVFDSQFGWLWGAITMSGPVMKLAFGPVALALLWFSYLLNLFVLVICIRWILNTHGLRRWQAIALSVPPLFILSCNMLSRVPLFQPFAPQLVGLLLGGIYITWVFYRLRLYSILPLAHDVVSRSMIDGLLVVDEKGYIVEMNATAKELFSGSTAAVGGAFGDLSATRPVLVNFDQKPDEQKLETVLSFSEGERHFQITMTPLIASGNHLLGKVFVLKDITRQKRDQATLIEQQKTLSVMAERERLGRELHDTRGQFPGYVKTQTQAIRLLLKRERVDDANMQLDQMIAAADTAFSDARELITSLRNVGKEWPFFQKLPDWLEQFRAMSGLTVDYSGPGQQPPCWVAPEAEVHLLRIIQEALTNARKHAGADRIQLELKMGNDRLTVTVTDNGRGFDVTAAESDTTRYGLGIIRERVAEIGGRCDISSDPAHGTTITIQAPLTSL
jgi:signal transduction histidine kinase